MGPDDALSASLALVGRFASALDPAPDAVLLAGSRVRGTFREDSDYDVVLLYSDLPQGAWREMIRFEGADFEVFAHDLRSLAYFFREIERPSGEPALARMVDDGVAVAGGGELERKARELARALLAAGPLPLDERELAQRRYAITDLAQALRSGVASAGRIALGSSLYLALGMFALRSSGRWGAGGKALPGALRELRPDLEQRFTRAFELLYRKGEDAVLQQLVTEVLEPFGGRLRGGFRQQAPPTWR